MKWTPAQKQAIQEKKRNLFILAGPGSGKTTVLACKVAELLKEGVPSHSILVTTFTHRATEEIKHRISLHCSAQLPHNLLIDTTHGLCRKIIREFYSLFQEPTQFSFLNDIDFRFFLLKEHETLGLVEAYFDSVFDASFGGSKEPIELLHDSIFDLFGLYQRMNENLIELPQVLKELQDKTGESLLMDPFLRQKGMNLSDEQILQIFQKYRKAMWQNKFLDHSQTLKVTHSLLTKFPDLRKTLQERWKFILVDEYQDLSLLQHQIFHLLLGRESQISILADERQSIYGFRGAKVSRFRNSLKDFGEGLVLHMEENFRSTKSIVDFSQKMMPENVLNLTSARKENSPPVFFLEKESPKESARQMAQIIRTLLEKKVITSYSQVALLFNSVRWNCIGWGYLPVLEEEGIPILLNRSGNYFDHPNIRVLMSLLSFLVFGKLAYPDFLSMLENLNFLPETIDCFLEKYDPIISRKALSNQNLESHYSLPNSLDKIRLNLLYQVLIDYPDNQRTHVLKIFFELLKACDLVSILFKKQDFLALDQIAYFSSLLRSYEEYSGEGLSQLLADLGVLQKKRFLEEVHRVPDPNRVLVSTIHNVKGLEYKVVFLCDFVAQTRKRERFRLPKSLEYRSEEHSKKNPSDQNNAHESSPFDESMRLFYVGITRAKDYLFLIYSKEKQKKNPLFQKLRNEPLLERTFDWEKCTTKTTPSSSHSDSHSNFHSDSSSYSNSTQNNKKTNETQKIPEKDKKNILTLSSSALETYEFCPLRYRWEYVFGFQSPKSMESYLGVWIHTILETIHFFRKRNHESISEWVNQEIENNFYSSGIYKYFLNNPQSPNPSPKKLNILQKLPAFLDQVKSTLNQYIENMAKPEEIFAIEKDFEICIDSDSYLKGRMDLILQKKVQNKKIIEIIDFKSSSYPKKEQLLLYALAWQKSQDSLDSILLKSHLFPFQEFLKEFIKNTWSPDTSHLIQENSSETDSIKNQRNEQKNKQKKDSPQEKIKKEPQKELQKKEIRQAKTIQQTVYSIDASPESIQKTETKLQKTIEAIRSESFSPLPSKLKCTICPFGKLCFASPFYVLKEST